MEILNQMAEIRDGDSVFPGDRMGQPISNMAMFATRGSLLGLEADLSLIVPPDPFCPEAVASLRNTFGLATEAGRRGL